MKESEKSGVPQVKDFKENHTETRVSFTVVFDKNNLQELLESGDFLKKMKVKQKYERCFGIISNQSVGVFDLHQ